MKDDRFAPYAGEYDQWFDLHQEISHAELARVRECFPPPDSRAIEIGIGSGDLLLRWGSSSGSNPPDSSACWHGITGSG